MQVKRFIEIEHAPIVLLNTTVLKARNIILFRKSVSLELKLHLFEFCLENDEDIYFVNMLFYLIQ